MLINKFIEPKIIKINEIEKKKLDSFVRIEAEISEVKETEGLFILTLKDETGEIKSILYKDKQNYEFEELIGENLEITGKIIEYNGGLEIEIEKIKAV